MNAVGLKIILYMVRQLGIIIRTLVRYSMKVRIAVWNYYVG